MSDAPGSVDAGVRGDLLVAGVAAGASVAITIGTRVVLGVQVGLLAPLAPLAVYPLYLLLGRGNTGSVLEDPRLWAGAAVLVAVAVFGLVLS
ncbi:MAG: hypothetical protein ABEJ81_08690 [Haloferacaceae archaeon]